MSASKRPTSERDFLQALWPEEKLPGRLVVWTLSKAKQRKESFWCSNLEEAEVVAKRYRSDRNVYFGVALQDPDKALAIARLRNPKAQLASARGSAESAASIPGLWVDIDVRADIHSSQKLPPDPEAAISLLKAFPLAPSLIVHTGYGFHVY